MTSFIDEVRAMQTFKRKRNHREQVKRERKKNTREQTLSMEEDMECIVYSYGGWR
jgi:chromatin segregation and condensation protein Rec8/ScpA/Scc1 (kleisin family)